MNRLIDKLFHMIDCFTGILTGLMVLFVFLNVVLRTFFNSGLTWSEELARYLFVYVTYTVSYTHLDVYKRQVLHRLIRHQERKKP